MCKVEFEIAVAIVVLFIGTPKNIRQAESLKECLRLTYSHFKFMEVRFCNLFRIVNFSKYQLSILQLVDSYRL